MERGRLADARRCRAIDEGEVNIDTDIRLLAATELPWDLLVEADPSRSQIEGYIGRSNVYGLFVDGGIIGVLVLSGLGSDVVEILNVAVSSQARGRGYGRQLVEFAVSTARSAASRRIEIGTGNSSLGQLYLYQSIGFRMVSIDRDFFVRNYPEPIEENGLRCQDMVRLAIEFLGNA